MRYHMYHSWVASRGLSGTLDNLALRGNQLNYKVRLTRNWSIFRTVSNVLIRSLIFPVAFPLSCSCCSVSSFSPTCSKQSGILSYICPLLSLTMWRTNTESASALYCNYSEWQVWWELHAHTEGEAAEVNTATWRLTIKCQQLLIQRGSLWVRQPIQQRPAARL